MATDLAPATHRADRRLTLRQWRFARAYVECEGNATQAALTAYPSQSYDAARTTGKRLLTKAHVRSAIDRILRERIASPERTQHRVQLHAFADRSPLAECVETVVTETEDGPVVSYRVNTEKVRASGLGPLVKSITYGRNGVKIDTTDPMEGLRLLARIQGIDVQRVKVGPDFDPTTLTDEQIEELRRQYTRG